MNITCVICCGLLTPSDDVFFTPCGHLFHFACLSKWMERSKTCPQCREKVSERSIHRIYFNFDNTDDTGEDTSTLQSRIISLELQLRLKDMDIKNCGTENLRYKKETAGLRAEVKKLESEINKMHSQVYALNEQTKFFREQSLEADAAKKEVIRLRKKVEEFRNIQLMINSSAEDVDEMLRGTMDRGSLITYLSVMKREITSNVDKRKELRDRVKALQQELTKVSMHRNHLLDEENKRKQLEEDLAHCESEKKSLSSKLRELEQTIASGSSTVNRDMTRFIMESPAPQRQKNLKEDNKADNSIISISSDNIEKGATENSPYLPVKSQGITALAATRMRHNMASASVTGFSILSKKPRLQRSTKSSIQSEEIAYDGFGGHSKKDDFPSPILSFKTKKLKNNTLSMKVKRRKVDGGSNKKLDDFFVDLT